MRIIFPIEIEVVEKRLNAFPVAADVIVEREVTNLAKDGFDFGSSLLQISLNQRNNQHTVCRPSSENLASTKIKRRK